MTDTVEQIAKIVETLDPEYREKVLRYARIAALEEFQAKVKKAGKKTDDPPPTMEEIVDEIHLMHKERRENKTRNS